MTKSIPAAKRKVIAQPRRYLLEISERQAQLVNQARRAVCRLGMGQFDMLDSFFPWESKIPGRERIRPLLQRACRYQERRPTYLPRRSLEKSVTTIASSTIFIR